jgi:hypothetical protein
MATITSGGTGNWTTGGTWVDGTKPTTGDAVVIASGHVVTLNENDSAEDYLSVTVNSGGTLSISTTASTYLRVSGNITNNGTIKTGTSTDSSPDRIGSAYTSTLAIECTTTTGQYGWETGSGAKYYLYGADKSYPYTTLNASITASDNSFTTVDTTGWGNNDVIFVYGTTGHDKGERREDVTSVSGTTVTITGTFANNHTAGIPVLNVTRNLKIISYHDTNHAYCRFSNGGTGCEYFFDNVEFRNIGAGGNYQKKGVLVRQTSTKGLYFYKCSFWSNDANNASATESSLLLETIDLGSPSDRCNPIVTYDTVAPNLEKCVFVSNSAGWLQQSGASNSTGFYIKDCYFGQDDLKASGFSVNINITDMQLWYFENCVFGNGGRTFEGSGNGTFEVTFLNCYIERYADVNIPSNSYMSNNWITKNRQIRFIDCEVRTDATTNDFVAGAYGTNISFYKYDKGTTDHRVMGHKCYVTNDTTVYNGASGSSLKVSPKDASNYGSVRWFIPCASAGTATVTVYYKLSATTWTNDPIFVLKRANYSASDSFTVVDTSSDWQSDTLSVTCAEGELLELTLWCKESSKYLNVDDISVSIA